MIFKTFGLIMFLIGVIIGVYYIIFLNWDKSILSITWELLTAILCSIGCMAIGFRFMFERRDIKSKEW